MEKNMEQTDRQKAMGWWNSLSTLEAFHLSRKYYPNREAGSLTGREIEKIWPKEESAPSPATLEGGPHTDWINKELSINSVESLHTDLGFQTPLIKNGSVVKHGFNFQRICRIDTYGYTTELKAEKKAIAEKLVTAWNCHDDLYKALDNLIDWCIQFTPEYPAALVNAKAALLKASPNTLNK